MLIGFVSPTVHALSETAAEALVLAVFRDERPLRGPAGLVDWRLDGLLTDCLLDGSLSGERGEQMMVAGGSALLTQRIMLFGAGRRDAFDTETYDEVTQGMLSAMSQAHIRSALLGLPGRSHRLVSAEDALVRFIRSADQHSCDEINLIECAESQQTMRRLVGRERSRSRSIGFGEPSGQLGS